MTELANIMGALVAEVRRVAGLRVHWERNAERANKLMPDGKLDIEPVLALIDGALDEAEKAADSGEAHEVLAALQGLKGFHG